MNNPFEFESCILHRQAKPAYHYPYSYSYRTTTSANDAPVIPPADIFSTLHENADSIPTIAQCAVHLELLEAFLVLKQRVIKSNALDNTFGTRRAAPAQKRTDAAWQKKREGKWERFVELAVLRFEVWWAAVVVEMLKKERGILGGEEETFWKDNLPPLDVLMVWHTYLLNPGVYRRDWARWLGEDAEGMERVGRLLRMPWGAVHEAIDHSSREYKLPEAAEENFKRSTKLPADLFKFLSEYEKMDERTLAVFAMGDVSSASLATTMNPLDEINGIRDKDLFGEESMVKLCGKRDCICLSKIQNELDPWKMVLAAGGGSGFNWGSLRASAAARTLLRATYPSNAAFNKVKSVQELKQTLLLAPGNQQQQQQQQPPAENTSAIKWLLETYTRHTETTPDIDLVAAIHRQQAFVDKMGHFLWIRSPYLKGTLTRAQTRYAHFFKLLAIRHKPPKAALAKPRPPVVPTIDIDLVWHTHQCSPAAYHAYCVEKVGKFVDHSDNLGEDLLRRGWEATKEVYWKKFGLPYGGCFCWVCEGVRQKSEQQMVAGTPEGWLASEVRKEVTFYRKVETSRRAGQQLPPLSAMV